MRTLRNPFFLLSVSLFALHQVSQKGLGLQIGWADSYLDNLLCFPILMGIWQVERQLRWKLDRLSGFEVLSAWLFLSFVFEVVFPKLSAGFTADWMDVVFYAAGAIGFYFLINPAVSSRLDTSASHGR